MLGADPGVDRSAARVPDVSEVEITVRGTARQFHPAERATVHARVVLEGPDARAVYAAVTSGAEQVAASIAPLHDPEHGPVTWWASQDVRTWARRPWHQEGRQLPLVHHAAVDVRVKFRDFNRLGAWLGDMAEVRGFRVDQVEWALTAVRRQALLAAARQSAVQNALEKAQAYADAAGLGRVQARALADAGMLGQGLHPDEPAGSAYLRTAAASAEDEGGLRLVPEDIEIAAAVDARFAVEAG